jgi:hypothetical protein
LYNELKNLNPDEYLQLISETKDKDEIEFLVNAMDIILQQRQRASMNTDKKL